MYLCTKFELKIKFLLIVRLSNKKVIVNGLETIQNHEYIKNTKSFASLFLVDYENAQEKGGNLK